MGNRDKNTYEPTEVNFKGGLNYGSNIHAVSVEINYSVWEMIKILDEKNLFGFHFIAKIGTKKTIIILLHDDAQMLKQAKKLLKPFYEQPNILFLTKVREHKNSIAVFIKFILLVSFLSILSVGGYFWVIKQDDVSKNVSPSSEVNASVVNSKVEIDIEKLKAFKEIMIDEKSETEAKLMKGLDMTVAIISSFVPPSKKAKYSSDTITKNFKGKSGIELVLVGDTKSKEFNSSVKELNAYAMEFVKKGEISQALKTYDKILEHKEITKEEKSLVLTHKADIYKHKGELKKAEFLYNRSLKISQSFKNKASLSFKAKTAWVKDNLAEIHKDLNQSKRAKKEFLEVEKNYLDLLKQSKKNSLDKAWALTLLGNFYVKQEHWSKAFKIHHQALLLYQKLAKKNSKDFNQGYFETLDTLGYLSLRQGKWEEAKYYYKEALSMYQKENKKEHLEILGQLAFIALKKGKYAEAKARYEKILEAYKKLEREGSKQTLHIAKTFNDMVRLSLTQQKNINISLLNQQLSTAQKLAKRERTHHPKEAQFILATSYAYRGFISMLQRDDKLALKYYKLSLAQSKRFSISKVYTYLLVKKEHYLEAEQSYTDMFDYYKEERYQAEILMLSGKFYLQSGISSAKSQLNKALKLYQKLEKKSPLYSEKIEEIENLLKEKQASL